MKKYQYKITMPEELDFNQQIALGNAALSLVESSSFDYCMSVIKNRIEDIWLNSSTTEDREVCWALATAHETFIRTLNEFSQRGEVAQNLSQQQGFTSTAPDDDAPA